MASPVPAPARLRGRAPRRDSRWPALVLLGVGGVAALLYALLVLAPLRLDRHPPARDFNLARALGEDWGGLARFGAGMLALFGLYLLALAVARRARRGAVAAALVGAAAQALAVLPAHPLYSFDAYHYLATARVHFHHGANPLVIPPAAVPADALTRLSDWPALPSPYGPLWSLLLAVPYHAVGGTESAVAQLLALKVFSGALALLSALCVGAAAERLRPGSRALAIVLFAWNPLVVLHAAGDAHNDIAMACLLAAALWLVASGRPVGAAAALALSVLVKFVTLLLLPLLIVWLLRSRRPARRREAALAVAVSALLALALYAPFWVGTATLAASAAEGGYLTTSLAALARQALTPLVGGEAATATALTAGRLLFLPLYGWLLWRVGGGPRRLLMACAGAMVLYVTLASPWFMPWYALTPLVCVAVLPGQRRFALRALVLALTLGALVLPVATNYLSAMSGVGDRWPWMNVVAVMLVGAPVLAVALWQQRARRARRARRRRRTEGAALARYATI